MESLRQLLNEPEAKYHSVTEWLLATSSLLPEFPGRLTDGQLRTLERQKAKSVRAIVRAWRREGVL